MSPLKTVRKIRSIVSQNNHPEDPTSDLYIPVQTITSQLPNKLRNRCLKQLDAKPDYPLIFNIDSNGGDIYALFSILDFWDTLRTKHDITIVTVCTGKAFSAGAILLSSGSVRYATPSSTVMIHEALGGHNYGNVHDVNLDIEELKRLNTLVVARLAKNIKSRPATLTKLFQAKRDIYLNAEQAKEMSIIDKIGYPEINVEAKFEYL
jgi:ATP-dependent Clp endopeptidase proteolytic subunit ClpP